jgi:CRISPR/Cas system type I-B associated protein Csh2 (Cas7 group RAMP superfamily)
MSKDPLAIKIGECGSCRDALNEAYKAVAAENVSDCLVWRQAVDLIIAMFHINLAQRKLCNAGIEHDQATAIAAHTALDIENRISEAAGENAKEMMQLCDALWAKRIGQEGTKQ